MDNLILGMTIDAYQSAMIAQNLLIFLLGAASSFIVATLICINIMKSITRDERIEGATLVRFETDKDKRGYILYVNPKTVRDYLHTYFTYIGWKLRGKQSRVLFKDERLGRIIYWGIIVSCVVLALLGIRYTLRVYPSLPIDLTD
ncbi:hypothetical protein [Bacillus cereus]|uniref:hypothetical protein n=1 Tax=Bacillus cereus TaxID=1396 RepID=UPI000BED78E6|nr:hypothetical protein [Bacillus cereus]PED33872.1 hypothetical protein CON13_01475 [Bacillus cereus]PEE52041.1 hypothetical protein COM80_16475 [Bacillus cereus]PFL90887.1 hypothetical protein COJ35_24150 [Bacillus cereus]PFV69482.1 hypothetical protein COL16_18575 [Bacillus cereus]PGS34942.1 hypothetical protein COC56_16500 [Bacillus cereus]